MDWDKYLSTTVKNLPQSGIRKYFDLAATMEGVLSLSIGEPDYAAPQKVLDACVEALKQGETSYTGNAGTIELREAIAELFHNRYHVDYDPKSEIMVTVGVSEGIDAVFRALIEPGDEVLIPEPAYVAYPAAVQLSGGIPVFVETTLEDDFELTVAQLEKKITPKTKALLMGFPNNPTGAIMPRKRLEELAEFAIKHDLIVVSDEIYCELMYEGTHTCISSIPGMRERSVILNGFSKAYAMTGMRVGYVCAPEPILKQALKIHQYVILATATNSQKGAVVALKECEADVEERRQEYEKRREIIVAGLQKLGFKLSVPKGAFYIFPSVEFTGLTGEEFAERLLLQEKVAVVPGSAFGPGGKYFIRISYAASQDTIQEALKRIGNFLESLNLPK